METQKTKTEIRKIDTQKKRAYKRPNPVLYFIFSSLIRLYNRLKTKMEIRGVKPEGPALLLANHNSPDDWRFMGSVCGMRRITFMCSNRFFVKKILGMFLRLLRVIPKHQFTTDLASMRKVKEVAGNGGMIYIAPEGTVYAAGRLGFISSSTAKFVKFLKIPVYGTRIEGASLGCAKWSLHRHKCPVRITTSLILTEEEVKTLDKDAVLERINKALSYDEFAYASEKNIRVKGDDLAEGFERMFYKCPVCGAEFSLSSDGCVVSCSSCGSRAVLGEDFTFKWTLGGAYKDKQSVIQKEFNNFSLWYEYQLKCMKEEVLSSDFKLEDEVEYGTDEKGNKDFVKVGKGVITLTRSGWDYSGTFRGEPFADHDDISSVFLVTLSPGRFFEMPYKDDRCRVFFPKSGNRAMKYHLASRAISELRESGEL